MPTKGSAESWKAMRMAVVAQPPAWRPAMDATCPRRRRSVEGARPWPSTPQMVGLCPVWDRIRAWRCTFARCVMTFAFLVALPMRPFMTTVLRRLPWPSMPKSRAVLTSSTLMSWARRAAWTSRPSSAELASSSDFALMTKPWPTRPDTSRTETPTVLARTCLRWPISLWARSSAHVSSDKGRNRLWASSKMSHSANLEKFMACQHPAASERLG